MSCLCRLTICDSEEDDDTADGKSGVQRRSEDVVVLAPPGVELAVDDLVEDQVDNVPRRIVDTGGRRHVIGSDKDQWPVDLANKVRLCLLEDEIRNRRQDKSDPEEVQETRVNGANGVETGGPDETPDDRRRENGATVGAGEAVGLLLGANTVDIAEHPKRDTSLGQCSKDRSKTLSKEEGRGRDLEVVAELHIGCEVQTLTDDIRAEDLEEDVGNRFTLEHIPSDELREHVQLVGVHVGDALDHAAGDHVDCGNDEGENDSPPRKTSVVALCGTDCHAEDDQKNDHPPPPLDSLV